MQDGREKVNLQEDIIAVAQRKLAFVTEVWSRPILCRRDPVAPDHVSMYERRSEQTHTLRTLQNDT